jgi:hypothetical protein
MLVWKNWNSRYKVDKKERTEEKDEKDKDDERRENKNMNIKQHCTF